MEHEEMEDESFDLAESLYSFTLKINGIDTQVSVNRCGQAHEAMFLAVNLKRGEEHVNSYTMHIFTDPKTGEPSWKFEEEYVPKDLKKLEGVISDSVIEQI